jgi:hypothetical protein
LIAIPIAAIAAGRGRCCGTNAWNARSPAAIDSSTRPSHQALSPSAARSSPVSCPELSAAVNVA